MKSDPCISNTGVIQVLAHRPVTYLQVLPTVGSYAELVNRKNSTVAPDEIHTFLDSEMTFNLKMQLQLFCW